MTDDKPYRSVISAGRSPFQPSRAELVSELDVILRMDYDLQDFRQLRDALERRRLELANLLFLARPTAADWAREDNLLGYDYNNRPIFKGDRAGVLLGEWLPATMIGVLKGGVSTGLIVVRVDGRETNDNMEPHHIILNHPCTREDIISSRAHETGIDVHESPPSAEKPYGGDVNGPIRTIAGETIGFGAILARGHERGPSAEQEDGVRDASIFADDAARARREQKLRELARDLLDAVHSPNYNDSRKHAENERVLRYRATQLAEFILGEKE